MLSIRRMAPLIGYIQYSGNMHTWDTCLIPYWIYRVEIMCDPSYLLDLSLQAYEPLIKNILK